MSNKINKTILFIPGSLIIVVIFTLSCYYSWSLNNKKSPSHRLPYTLNEIYNWSDKRAVEFAPLDLENDGSDELLFLIKEKEIKYSFRLYRGLSQQVLGEFSYPKADIFHHAQYPPFLHFKTPEGQNRFCVSIKHKNEIYLDIFDKHLQQKTRIPVVKGYDQDGNGFWDGKAFPVAAEDLNRDNHPEIILIVFSAYDKLPRGIWVIDVKNSTPLWSFPTGTAVTDFAVADVNNDGNSEIVFGGSAIGNGAEANGTDDNHSYLIVLDRTGKRIWQQETGGMYSGCFPKISDLQKNEDLKIITIFRSRGPNTPVSGILRIRDAKTMSIEREYPAIKRSSQFIISDLNYNGHNEIIVSIKSPEPELLILTDSLYLYKKIFLPFNASDIMVADLNMDRKKEIIVSNKLKNTIIFNNRLKKIAEINIGGNLFTYHQNFDKPALLAIHKSDNHIIFLEMDKSHLINIIPVEYIVFGFILGCLFICFVIFLVQWFKPEFTDSRMIKSLVAEAPVGILWLDRKDRIRICNPAAEEILEINKNITDKNLKNTGQKIKKLTETVNKDIKNTEQIWSADVVHFNKKDLSIIVIPYRKIFWNNGYIYILKDTTDKSLSQKALFWSSIAQKLSHEIKNPLSTVLLTLQRLQMAYQEDKVKNINKYNTYTQSVIEEIGRLRKVTDGFMKFTRIKPPAFKPMPVETVIKKIEKRTREWLPDNVHLKIEVETNLPDINIDMDEIQTLFYNIFDNAVKAMDGEGRLTMRVSLAEWIEPDEKGGKIEKILFEISDTGCGIPEEKIEDLLKPYVHLRKQGTGLGLTICKRIAEDHGGCISIRSRVDVGTSITIEIPVWTKEK